ncbi:hypothetical protein SEA_ROBINSPARKLES_3 [Gordonia phage RobinSparkles]|nr:hypothetical protein SEA_ROBINSPARKLES_3 [Gordonia phage RobinSparkles]
MRGTTQHENNTIDFLATELINLLSSGNKVALVGKTSSLKTIVTNRAGQFFSYDINPDVAHIDPRFINAIPPGYKVIFMHPIESELLNN